MAIDKKMEAHIRPRFVELLRLQDTKQMDEAARRFFARKEAVIRQEDPDYKVDRAEFWNQFRIDITRYVGYFIEIGGTPNLRGAYFPTKKVRPIFTVQRSRTGKTWKVVAHSCPGFFNNAMDRAWVEVDDYEEMLGDNFFEELQSEAEKTVQRTIKKSERVKASQRKRVKARNRLQVKKELGVKSDA